MRIAVAVAFSTSNSSLYYMLARAKLEQEQYKKILPPSYCNGDIELSRITKQTNRRHLSVCFADQKQTALVRRRRLLSSHVGGAMRNVKHPVKLKPG